MTPIKQKTKIPENIYICYVLLNLLLTSYTLPNNLKFQLEKIVSDIDKKYIPNFKGDIINSTLYLEFLTSSKK